MKDAFLNVLRGEAERVAAQAAPPRLATVVSYDPDAYSVKVLRQPEGVETGWLPVQTVWGGDGWGFFAPPVPGAQVELIHQEGGLETAVCRGTLFSEAHRPQVDGIGGAPAGELWIVHKSGARFRLLNDSEIELRHKTESRLRLLEDSTIEFRHRDGTRQRFMPDGSHETVHKDGSRIVMRADGGIEAVHSSTSRIVLHPDGAIEMKQAGGSFVALHASGTIELRAPRVAAAAEGAAVVRLVHEAFVALYNSHVHGNGPPTAQQLTAEYLTSSLVGR